MTTYTYDQVLEASVKYFNGDELAAKVFTDKYALQDREGKYHELTPTDMHKRLAKEFARIEAKYPNPMSEDEIFGLFDKFKYVLPQGSPISAIGNPYYVQSSGNCFVINSPYDSYGGICKTDQELAQLMKRRAGVGLDISTIRPKGLPTKNAAKTTDGIAIFMERFSNTCREVAMRGRRGALIETISIEHPEVETFINIKKDLKKVTGANISIRLTDEFMKSVKEDKEFTLRWPVESLSPVVQNKVSARKIWDQIIDSAWTSAEPGLLFWDTVIKNSPADIYGVKDRAFKTQSTNPCQPSWATVLTPNGISTIGKVEIGDIIWSGSRWTQIINKINTGTKEVYAFKTTAGTFYGTKEHRVVSNGNKIKADEATSIDIALGNCENKAPSLDPKDVLDGLVVGDGMMHKASNNKIVLLIGENDKDYFSSEISHLLICERPGITDEAWDVDTTIRFLPKTYERIVPENFLYGNPTKVRGFLKGLYSANGSIVDRRITLKASSFSVIESVQKMLSSIGISSYFTTNKKKNVQFSNGNYECKQSYDLNIGNYEGKLRFKNLIGFLQIYKQNKLDEICTPNKLSIKKNFKIVNKNFVSTEIVYDLTVDDSKHTYWSDGLLISNCGEITLGIDSCRLLLINLSSFVTNPFTNKSKFNFEKFSDVVVKAQRLMDDLIDLEQEYISKILAKIESDPEPEEIKSVELNLWKEFKRTCAAGRRTGLGITALGDTLAFLGIKYGSEKSIKMCEQIYKNLAVNAYKASCIMAKERGAFPLFEYELEKNHPFIKKIMNEDPELESLYSKYGRRNIALTTTAPAGSMSTLTQTTSGIEPAYLLSYVRRKKINPSDKNAKVDFTDDLGDKWQEFNVYHHGVKQWMDITGEKDIKNSPYWGATSNEIDWKASVDIQATAQSWICHAISKTCNLPSTATKELVSEVYTRAYEKGCKGFTVYRDGCRSGVLVSEETHKKQNKITDGRPSIIEYVMAPKRPDELLCDIKKAKIQGEAWTIFTGLLNGNPYELFGGLSKYVDIPNKYKTGKIIKNGKVDGLSTYNVIVGDGDDQLIIKDVANVFENANYGAFTRTISLALRHGTPIQYVVEQLSKDKHSDITSFSKVIARVLKSYIKDGTQASSEKSCPSCKAENSLIYQEGCLSCTQCGFSKCG